MTISARDLDIIRQYIDGVMERSDHHAKSVKGAALALLGGVLWRADLDSIEIKQYGGDLANVLWFEVGGNRIALAYNHKTGNIEARDRSTQGNVLFQCDDKTGVSDIEQFFSGL